MPRTLTNTAPEAVKRYLGMFCALSLGAIIAFGVDHVRPTMWGWVWTLEPKPDFYGSQLVQCRDGSLTLPPWHVLVLYEEDMGLRDFLQERGR